VETANDLEHIGDRIATGMVTSARKRIKEDVNVSPATAEVLNEYHAVVCSTLDDALKAATKQKTKLAKRVRQRKKDFSELTRSIAEHGLGRLTADEPNRLNTYAREMEVMEILKGVFTIAQRIARKQVKAGND
jgi:phosphate:Na+ symporter